MKNFFWLLAFLLFTIPTQGQNFNCDLIFWDAIRDTVNMQSQPAIFIELSTVENEINTGYTTFLILNNEGDTIVDYSNAPHHRLPATLGNLYEKYILDLLPPHTTIGENFNGKLITNFPVCEFELRTTSTYNPDQEKNVFNINPNPFTIQFVFKNTSSHSGWLEIFNINGQLVFRRYVTETNHIVDTSRWVPGVYWLKFNNSISKILKQ